MSAAPRPVLRIALGFLWLAAFSFLYTAGESVGLWPQVLPGAFRDWDLAAGAVSLVALVAALVGWRHRPRNECESPEVGQAAPPGSTAQNRDETSVTSASAHAFAKRAPTAAASSVRPWASSARRRPWSAYPFSGKRSRFLQ